ncbi:hypothetical protein FB555_000801 [Alpinimonas psychrophila]|uniref:Uncharacterized protein n=1 Tax=Alpinimonas psychrophila TaxID=748908 RepID=A0A7W3JT42_9MICO|nr:hypothetical protein [Alpinimonas psychrophila]
MYHFPARLSWYLLGSSNSRSSLAIDRPSGPFGDRRSVIHNQTVTSGDLPRDSFTGRSQMVDLR